MNVFIPGTARFALGPQVDDQPVMTHKSVGLTYMPMTTKAVDEGLGEVTAAINTLSEVDLQKEVMEPNCWSGVLKEMRAGKTRWPAVLLGHEWNQVCGKVTDAWEEAGQLIA